MRGFACALVLVLAAAPPAGAEKLQLVIKQEFEKTRAHVSLDPALKLFLDGAGLKVDPRAEYKLLIELDGSATSSTFQADEWNARGQRSGRKSERWLSASVVGSCELWRGGERVQSGGFTGDGEIDKAVLHGGQYASRAQAPYQAAADHATLAGCLAAALRPIVEPPAMVRALDALDAKKIPDDVKAEVLCLLTRESDASAVDRVAAQLERRGVAFDSLDAIKQQKDPKLAGAAAFVRLKRTSSDDERAAIARYYGDQVLKTRRCWCGDGGADDLGILRAMGPAIEDVLVEKVKDYDRDVLGNAARRAAALKLTRAVPTLGDVARRDADDWYKRTIAISALEGIGDPAACPALKEAAAYPMLEVRKPAENAMKKLHCE
ncbi:MAG TPA: HEAT repeat domain-containing protein [Polyangia bacterium]|nr:HEAT repeat domain-containing protein [Polyangia bacterium]